MRRYFLALVLLLIPHGLVAQPAAQPRKQFVTVTFDRLNASPIKFRNYPLEQIAGEPLKFDYVQRFYHNDDESVSIHDVRIDPWGRAVGIMVYPFGVSNGTTLVIRGRSETLPSIRFHVNRPGGQDTYTFEGARSRDLGLGAISCQRKSGWAGLGTCAFVIVGTGWIDQSRGQRYVVEGGARISVGPVGGEIFFGVNYHTLSSPERHNFMTVPLGLRAVLSF